MVAPEGGGAGTAVTTILSNTDFSNVNIESGMIPETESLLLVSRSSKPARFEAQEESEVNGRLANSCCQTVSGSNIDYSTLEEISTRTVRPPNKSSTGSAGRLGSSGREIVGIATPTEGRGREMFGREGRFGTLKPGIGGASSDGRAGKEGSSGREIEGMAISKDGVGKLILGNEGKLGTLNPGMGGTSREGSWGRVGSSGNEIAGIAIPSGGMGSSGIIWLTLLLKVGLLKRS